MFIAMNRFRVTKGSESAFEHVWLSRDSYLDKVPGFVEFHLLRGPEADDDMGEPRGLRSLDPVRSVPGRASRRRRPQAALSRAPAVRRIRRPPDGGTREGPGRIRLSRNAHRNRT